jgi:hypothetical protein
VRRDVELDRWNLGEIALEVQHERGVALNGGGLVCSNPGYHADQDHNANEGE